MGEGRGRCRRATWDKRGKGTVYRYAVHMPTGANICHRGAFLSVRIAEFQLKTDSEYPLGFSPAW